MRRMEHNMLQRLHLYPPVRRATAGKDQRMHAVTFDYCKLKIWAERRRRNRFPRRVVVHHFCSRVRAFISVGRRHPKPTPDRSSFVCADLGF